MTPYLGMLLNLNLYILPKLKAITDGHTSVVVVVVFLFGGVVTAEEELQHLGGWQAPYECDTQQRQLGSIVVGGPVVSSQ